MIYRDIVYVAGTFAAVLMVAMLVGMCVFGVNPWTVSLFLGSVALVVTWAWMAEYVKRYDGPSADTWVRAMKCAEAYVLASDVSQRQMHRVQASMEFRETTEYPKDKYGHYNYRAGVTKWHHDFKLTCQAHGRGEYAIGPVERVIRALGLTVTAPDRKFAQQHGYFKQQGLTPAMIPVEIFGMKETPQCRIEETTYNKNDETYEEELERAREKAREDEPYVSRTITVRRVVCQDDIEPEPCVG